MRNNGMKLAAMVSAFALIAPMGVAQSAAGLGEAATSAPIILAQAKDGGGRGPATGNPGGPGGGRATAPGGGGGARATAPGGGGGRATAPGGGGGRAAAPPGGGGRAVEPRGGVSEGRVMRGGRRGEAAVVRGSGEGRAERRGTRGDTILRGARGPRPDARVRGGGDRPWRAGRRYSWGDGGVFYFYNGYYYGDCSWLRRRAELTGSRYWRQRYRLCRAGY